MIDLQGKNIYLPRGDTGMLKFSSHGDYVLTNKDVVLFTVTCRGKPVIELYMTPYDSSVIIEFTSDMTKDLPIDLYYYDIRIILDAEFDEEDNLIQGIQIDTPYKDCEFNLLSTEGEL